MDLLEDDTDQTLGTLDSFIDDFPDGGAGELLEESSPKEDEEDTCSLCNEGYSDPRALSCLHTFCKVCLENLLVDESGDNLKINKIIECPKCKQETKVGDKGVAVESIPCGFILRDGPDKVEVPKPIIFCTSCKTQEAARSSCAECASFLCTNCNMAHQFMCCFSEHTVTLLEKQPESTDLAGSCKIHPGQAMGYFCFTCASLTCNACYLASHAPPDHQCEHLSKAEPIVRGEITSLIDESKCKVEFYEDAACNLENGLSELQSQRDNAKDLINETFQSYKAILEKQRDHQLEELKKLHTAHELKIMESFHNVEQTMEKIEDACQFSTKLLSCGNPTDILALKATVERQLLNLINNAPKPDVNVALDFETDIEKFEASVKETFGSFRSDKAVVPKETSPSPVSQEPAVAPTAGVGVTGSAPASTSPVSLPASMQSSFEGELAASFAMPHSVIGQPANISPVSPNNLHNLTTIQEYNLQQLANLAVNVNVKEDQVIPASAAPSPTPSFTLADLFGGDVGSANNALNNLQALAQLGSVALNGTGINGDALAARRYHTPTPSPPPTNMPPTLNALINDFANGCGHPMGTNMILGRGDSSSTLEISTPFPMNLSSLSGSPSPNLSDDILNDTMLNGLSSTSNGYHFRTSAGVGKLSPMQIRCKYGQLGPSKGQFNSPHGFCLGADEDIIVADTNNHRIQVFDKVGAYKFQFGMPGKEEGQLWYPRKVAVMRNSGKFVVCDRGNERSRMQIFTKNGHFVKKIAIRYVDIVAGLAVTNQGHIVAVDSVSPTVFVISEAGDLIRWFDCSDYMREPSDIAINGREFFVCDFKGHCVVVFNEEGHFMRRIGAENITNFPNGIDISDAGDVLVGDSHGNRFHVAVFTRSGSLLSEFECPYVKVSRCCGLKITSEGYVVTLAKNNHHVLVLNTLYIH